MHHRRRRPEAGARRRPHRFLPSSLAARMTLLLVGFLIAALWTSAALYIHDRAETTFRLFSESVADRIREIVPLVERTPAADRDPLIRALNSPTLWMTVTYGNRPAMPREWRRDRRPEDRIRSHLPDLGERRVLIRTYDHWRRQSDAAPPMPGGRPAPPDLLDSRVKVLIAVALRTGGWINFVASTDTTSLRWAVRIAFWILCASVLVVILAFWAIHRMTRPLRRFAEAAERIGLDVRSPPLPEHGSRELRNATRAFNEMQHRLRRFVDDRTMMLAAISHDLRTMLTRLKLRAEFIEDEEQRNKAVADLNEMQSMLDSTLAFARDDAGDEPRTQTDVAALVRSICDDHADAGGNVVCEAPERLPFWCAPAAVKRLVQNLVTNALKYGGGAAVKVADEGDRVSISVADRGPGIPADRREDVFRPFFRLETSRSRETGGSGLGLAVARSIARRHGGDIAIEDRDGGGAVFRFWMPHTPIGETHGRASGARTD
jgi:signal transduction histidine kinase